MPTWLPGPRSEASPHRGARAAHAARPGTRGHCLLAGKAGAGPPVEITAQTLERLRLNAAAAERLAGEVGEALPGV